MVPKVEPVMGGEKDHGGLSFGENTESEAEYWGMSECTKCKMFY